MKLNDLWQERIKLLICIFLLFTVTFTIFHHTIQTREPWFGVLGGADEWGTGSTIKFADNWYQEGPLNLKFAMLENPKSIEFQTISSRSPYTSYPPGAVIPIYIISELEGHKPTVAMVMGYNLLNQFLIAFILALTIFFLLRRLKIDIFNSFLFSIIPSLLMLLLPGPLYWFQNVFFSDQAVILPFVIYIFLEVFRDGIVGKNLRILNVIQNIVLFYGFLTDWLFVFIALTVYTKRVIDGEIVLSRNFSLTILYTFLKGSIKYWFVPIIALILFAIQVFILGNIRVTVSKFLFQSGISQIGAEHLNNGLNKFLGNISFYYGKIGLFLLFISAAIYLIISFYIIFKSREKQKVGYDIVKVKKILYLIGMFLIPCVLQVYFLKTHSIIHVFSVLKFSVPISTIPLVLSPVLIFLLTENLMSKKVSSKFTIFSKFLYKFRINPRLFLIFLLAFSATLGYISVENPNYNTLYPAPNYNYEIIGNSIQKNTDYNDVLFSPDFGILENPPQQLSYSMKRVYQINSTEDIKNKVSGLKGNYHIVVMFLNPPSNYWKKVLDNSTYVTDGTIYYYRIKNI